MALTKRKQEIYLEALERMRDKPRSRASIETIDKMIDRIKYQRTTS